MCQIIGFEGEISEKVGFLSGASAIEYRDFSGATVVKSGVSGFGGTGPYVRLDKPIPVKPVATVPFSMFLPAVCLTVVREEFVDVLACPWNEPPPKADVVHASIYGADVRVWLFADMGVMREAHQKEWLPRIIQSMGYRRVDRGPKAERAWELLVNAGRTISRGDEGLMKLIARRKKEL